MSTTALIGPRGNGRTTKLVQWALASGGTIVVSDQRRAERLCGLGVPVDQVIPVRMLAEADGSHAASRLTLYAIDDVIDVLGALAPALQVTPDLITFYGGAMQP